MIGYDWLRSVCPVGGRHVELRAWDLQEVLVKRSTNLVFSTRSRLLLLLLLSVLLLLLLSVLLLRVRMLLLLLSVLLLLLSVLLLLNVLLLSVLLLSVLHSATECATNWRC